MSSCQRPQSDPARTRTAPRSSLAAVVEQHSVVWNCLAVSTLRFAMHTDCAEMHTKEGSPEQIGTRSVSFRRGLAHPHLRALLFLTVARSPSLRWSEMS